MHLHDEITIDNVSEWVSDLPEHHRVKIEDAWKRSPDPSGHLHRLDQETRAVVEQQLGPRPPMHTSFDNLTEEQLQECRDHSDWVKAYEKLARPRIYLQAGKALQQQQIALSMALGVPMTNEMPDQAEGLDQTQSATVKWLQSTGDTPLEFLATTYRDTQAKMGDRITAARALLDYVHRKVPSQQEIKVSKPAEVPTLDHKVFSQLSIEDLTVLETILEKAKHHG